VGLTRTLSRALRTEPATLRMHRAEDHLGVASESRTPQSTIWP